ncbi:hypothetical protein [Rickettsiella massiliensis]|uniref:hypothetical protein n=1 Tax=Rickettsiella massiliensis TaxID=676517 RepID=UPI00029A496B|nr:hypothetical protein [Rickettsiella massiliensis]
MSESNFLNLIPTSNLLNYTDLLNGNLSSDEIIVKLSKTEDIGKWNPENLNEILFKFKVDSLEFMNRHRFFKFNIRIPEEIKSSTDYLINEVGLFFKDKAKNNDILIAHVYIENSLSLIELEGFFLQLILPYPINQEIDLELVEEQNNLIYSKLEKKEIQIPIILVITLN